MISQQHFFEVQALVDEIMNAWEKAQVVARMVKREKKKKGKSVWQTQQNFLLDAIFDCPELAHVDLDDNMLSFKWNELIKSVLQVLDALRIISSTAVQWSISTRLPVLLKAHKFRISRMVLFLVAKCWVTFESIKLHVKQIDDEVVEALGLERKNAGNLIIKEIFVLIQVGPRDKDSRSHKEPRQIGKVDLHHAERLARSIGGAVWVDKDEKDEPKAFNLVVPCVSSKFMNSASTDDSDGSFSDQSDESDESEMSAVVDGVLNGEDHGILSNKGSRDASCEDMPAGGITTVVMKINSNRPVLFGQYPSKRSAMSDHSKKSEPKDENRKASKESDKKKPANSKSQPAFNRPTQNDHHNEHRHHTDHHKKESKNPYLISRRISDPLVPAKSQDGASSILPRFKMEQDPDKKVMNPRIAGKPQPVSKESRMPSYNNLPEGVKESLRTNTRSLSLHSSMESSQGLNKQSPSRSTSQVPRESMSLCSKGSSLQSSKNLGDPWRNQKDLNSSCTVSSFGSVDTPVNGDNESQASSGFGNLEDVTYSAPELMGAEDIHISPSTSNDEAKKFRPLFSCTSVPMITSNTEDWPKKYGGENAKPQTIGGLETRMEEPPELLNTCNNSNRGHDSRNEEV